MRFATAQSTLLSLAILAPFLSCVADARQQPPSAGFSTNDLQIRTDTTSSSETMPSLFGPSEKQYDRYAACLAATEGLRRMRDTKLKNNSKGFLGGNRRGGGEEQQRINAEYLVHSSRVLEAMGMTVSQFNQLGRTIREHPILKDKVFEQAYLYRMSSSLDMERIPLLEDPNAEKLLLATRKKRMEMFCESMHEIEQLRSDQMSKLQKSLSVSHGQKLPNHVRLSDPSVMPFLSPKVRAVVEAFPLQAEDIVKKHGLDSDEFNRMLNKAKGNPLFRFKVEQYMKAEDSK